MVHFLNVYLGNINLLISKKMASQNPSLPSDPRLNKPAHYNRDEVVSDIQSLYAFLPTTCSPLISPSSPTGRWEAITAESLANHGINKTDEAIALLGRLPYIDGAQPWIMTTALSCNYQLVALKPIARSKPGWLFDAAKKQWPPWVVQLTAGRDHECHCYMLDTTDGTISCYPGFEYPPRTLRMILKAGRIGSPLLRQGRWRMCQRSCEACIAT